MQSLASVAILFYRGEPFLEGCRTITNLGVWNENKTIASNFGKMLVG